MVSTMDYFSFKELDLRRQRPFNVFVAIILILLVIAYKPRIMLFLLLITYILSGPVMTAYRHQRKRKLAVTGPLLKADEKTPNIHDQGVFR
jgi:CDP-diacylglycerol--serine O-phosphatidyltransferase